MYRKNIENALRRVSGLKEVDLEIPENSDFGDYSSNVALQLKTEDLKHKSRNPRQVAEEIVGKLKNDKNLQKVIEKIEVAGPGFINFWLKNDLLVDNLTQIDTAKDNFGKSNLGKGKTVVIDYSAPNIAKFFGIGHLRSTIIGQTLYNLFKFLGYSVIGDNHLGDWGTQFGKLLYMIKSKGITEFDLQELEDLYVEFHRLAEKDEKIEDEARDWFKKLEEGDPEAKQIWQKCIDISLKEYDKIYKLLKVKIDFAFGESYYESEMRTLLESQKVQKYLTKGEGGAKIIDLSKFGIKTPLMFLKSNGTTTYATRDLATISFRVRKWDPEIIIYEVGSEQSFHFRQVFAAAKLIGLVKDDIELKHVAHGLYLAPDGKKFSTRKGKTVKLEDILTEAVSRAEKLGNKDKAVARMVGIGAIKYFDLMHSVGGDVVFDWEKLMNLEGNSGPYLQYTVVRTNSLLRKAMDTKASMTAANAIDKLVPEELLVLRALSRFPEVIISAAKNYSPNLLCNYLYDLAQKYNSYYNNTRILGSENEEFRVLLTKGVSRVLTNGLFILGIEVPEKM